MTRAVEDAALWPGDDRAGEMRALLAVGDELPFVEPDEHAEIIGLGVAEYQRAADGHLVQ
jgi:hypothetical protein